MKTIGKILLFVTLLSSFACLLYCLIDLLYKAYGKNYLSYRQFDKI